MKIFTNFRTMNTEQKAKAYDEALERMKSWARGEHPECFTEAQKTAEFIFPELKESEDERIKKTLIDYFKTYKKQEECGIKTFFGIPTDDIISWLEKQDEQKPVIEMITPEESLGIDSKTYNKIVNDCIFGEDKPKFKVGDWIISNFNTVCYVESISEKNYHLRLNDGYHEKMSINYVDRNFHLWTIADAKDGDVLIDKSNNRECPFIFKETKPSNIKTECLNPLTVLGYCGIGGAGFTKGSGWGDTANCIYYPATKEQRDLLFQKMHEAGYMWNAESKQLLSLRAEPCGEQRHFDYENANIQQKDFVQQKDIPRYSIGDVLCDKSCTTLNKKLQSNFEITDIRNGLYICDKCSFPISQQDEYELVAKRIEPAWSEKDEENFRDIVGAIHAVAYQTTEDEESRLEWLYDIKQRMGG